MARADAGLTISELARRAGVSRDTISNAERGQHGLQATTLNKVARALGKTPSELLAEEERLAPKVESRSSLEPTLFNGLEDERHFSRFSDAIIAAAVGWGGAMASPDMDDAKRFGLIDAALDLSDVISERVEEEDWEALPNQERREIVTTMEKLGEVAEQGLRHLKESREARAQEAQVNQRREQIRELTRRISA